MADDTKKKARDGGRGGGPGREGEEASGGRKATARRRPGRPPPAKTAAAKKADAWPWSTPTPTRSVPAAARARYLVVVESPAKAKTIKKYLGTGYTVKASVGHVKDLPKSKMGVDVEHDFTPEYHVIKGKEKVAQRAEEGGRGRRAGVPRHRPRPRGRGHRLAHQRGAAPPERAAGDVQRDHQEGHPGGHRPPARARPGRSTTRSRRGASWTGSWATRSRPLLWKKVRRGLSAGRVQSVAVRLIVEREREIKAFVPVEYWTLEPSWRAAVAAAVPRQAVQAGRARRRSSRTRRPPTALVDGAAEARTSPCRKVDRRERRRNAPAPFITSQAAAGGGQPAALHRQEDDDAAQRLYEGVALGDEGQTALITYMRTDSTRLSDDAVKQVREFIGRQYGEDYLPDEPMVYKSRRAPRTRTRPSAPTSLEYPPERVRPFLERRGHVPALRAHLEPLRGVPDEARGLRPDDRGHHRGPGHVPRRGLP